MLEVVIRGRGYTDRTVAKLHITQVETHGGSVRSYAVTSLREPMRDGETMFGTGIVKEHDREEPVWELIKKAIDSLTELPAREAGKR